MAGSVLADLGVGIASGLIATKTVMEPAQKAMDRLEPRSWKKQSERVQPEPANAVAARKTLRLLGISLPEEQQAVVSAAFHYAVGMSWGPLYFFMRRRLNLSAWLAGLATGAAVFGIMDEAISPALGFSATAEKYAEHARESAIEPPRLRPGRRGGGRDDRSAA